MKNFILHGAFFVFTISAYGQGSRIWSTYYGSTGTDESYSVASDTFGNVYIAGITDSPGGLASGGFQNSYGGGNTDAFLVKFDSSGNRLWATYYGGPDDDGAYDVCTDQAGNVYLAGYTLSTSGIAAGGYKNSYSGARDAFLAKFDPNGNRLWATYFGDSLYDEGDQVETDAQGNVYFCGFTSSVSGIAVSGFQNTFAGGTYDAFLVKFNAAGSLQWSTYYGGTGNDNAYGVAISAAGEVYLAGQTNSPGGVASSGFQNSIGGGFDAYLVKFSSGGARVWATYYGGTGGELGLAAATDPSGNVFLSGTTLSASGIAFNGHQNSFAGGNSDAFVVKFSSAGARLWGTYYGGAQYEGAWQSLATNANGDLFFSGDSYSSTGIGTSSGFQNFLAGTHNTFVAAFSPAGTRLCGSYYGQTSEYNGHAVIDRHGRVYLAGCTNSASGIASGGFQNSYAGSTDAFLAKFTACSQGMGLNEIGEPGFALFPTVSEGVFYLSRDEGSVITVYAASGTCVLTVPVTRERSIDLSFLPSGLYLAVVDNSLGRHTCRIIIQR
jgi:hypothetical protein